MLRRVTPTARVLWILAWPILAQEGPRPEPSSLEQLLNTPVTVASRRSQVLMDSPQAAEVITAEDIRASGAFRLTDVLKLATNLQVWEKDPTRTTVSLRGMNPNDNPRTLQVLVDGVPMFNLVAASLDWNALPVPVDAIERVEIVRGPSSSLWGANAQMGVIAITTRQAEAGTGGSLRLGWASPGVTRGQAWMSGLVAMPSRLRRSGRYPSSLGPMSTFNSPRPPGTASSLSAPSGRTGQPGSGPAWGSARPATSASMPSIPLCSGGSWPSPMRPRTGTWSRSAGLRPGSPVSARSSPSIRRPFACTPGPRSPFQATRSPPPPGRRRWPGTRA